MPEDQDDLPTAPTAADFDQTFSRASPRSASAWRMTAAPNGSMMVGEQEGWLAARETSRGPRAFLMT